MLSNSGIIKYSSCKTVDFKRGASSTFVIALRQFLAPSITFSSSSSSASSLYLFVFYELLFFSEF